MELFKVHTENHFEKLIWKEKMPESYEGVILPGSRPTVLTGDFGTMLFQHVTAAEYSIWLSNYALTADRTFTAHLDFPTIELNMLISNNVLYQLRHIGKIDLKETQFNITYAPYMENQVRLRRAQRYTTFDIHFQLSYLKKIAKDYPDAVLPFMDNISSNTHVSFYDTHQYATPQILYLSREILRVLSAEIRDGLKLDLLVKLLFIEAITCRRKPQSPKQEKLAEERDRIRHITTLILSDSSRIKTTGELSLEARMNTKKLKNRFKEVNGTSIRRYWQRYRMEKSHEMVVNHRELTMKEIGHIFGYSDGHSFGKAFKKCYDKPPTYFRK